MLGNSNGELIVDSSDSYYVGFDIPFDSTYYYVFKHDNSWEEIQRYYLWSYKVKLQVLMENQPPM